MNKEEQDKWNAIVNELERQNIILDKIKLLLEEKWDQ